MKIDEDSGDLEFKKLAEKGTLYPFFRHSSLDCTDQTKNTI